MDRFTVVTLGCRVNHCESEAIARELATLGWNRADQGQTADVAVINTCCVTEKAAMQSRQAIRRALNSHPGARIVVTGCYAQTEPEAVQRIAGVHALIGQADKHRLARLLALGQPMPEDPPPIAGQRAFSPYAEPALGSRTRPLLKIQDGCNSFCTYCIVPHARGRSRSLDPDKVVATIGQIRAAGFHEVVLTGIHMGAYGLDLNPRIRLHDLLLRLIDERPIDRIRLSSIEPQELDAQIIDLVARNPIFCRHFHVPLQSLDDGILNAMGRPYRADGAAATVMAIADRIPDAAIGADILVGFPGESPAAFARTMDRVGRLPLTYLHVFPFSPRKPTPASQLAGRLHPSEMAERCRLLRDLGKGKTSDFRHLQIGKRAVVITEKQEKNGTRAMSDNYLSVLVQPALAPNTMVTVRLCGSTRQDDLLGRHG